MFRAANSACMLRAVVPSIQPVTRIPTPILRLKHTTSRPEGIRSNESQEANRPVYLNKHKEEILFCGQYPPRGYTFVPAGNPFITRHCRRLAKETEQKIYAYYRPQSKKGLAKQDGLFVPEAILEDIQSQYDTKKATATEKQSKKLDRTYPNMPSEDKDKFQRLYSSVFLRPDTALDLHVRQYVLNQYTAFESLWSLDLRSKAFTEASQKADEILSTWRGKEPGI